MRIPNSTTGRLPFLTASSFKASVLSRNSTTGRLPFLTASSFKPPQVLATAESDPVYENLLINVDEMAGTIDDLKVLLCAATYKNELTVTDCRAVLFAALFHSRRYPASNLSWQPNERTASGSERHYMWLKRWPQCLARSTLRLPRYRPRPGRETRLRTWPSECVFETTQCLSTPQAR